MKRVLLGMSGGVDSAVAATLLQREGYEVHGVTLKTLPQMDSTAIADAENVAKSLGMTWELVDVSEDFKKRVTDPFLESFQRGETPNPCVICNKEVKLKYLFQVADKRGYCDVATGHYARIERDDEGYGLFKGLDDKKDQSYFLYAIDPAWLPRLRFPLGGWTKDKVRQLAAEARLAVASKKDSEDLCFVFDGDLEGYFTDHGVGDTPGSYVDAAGRVLGTHRGVHHYTIGQRKGLGIALGQKVFVTRIDAATNEVVLGTHEQLMAREVTLREFQWLRKPKPDDELTGRGRYGGHNEPLTVDETGGEVHVTFIAPQRALTPGQSLVIYREEQVLGGGVIETVCPQE